MAFNNFVEIPFISRDGESYTAIIQKDGLWNVQTFKGDSSPVNVAFADGSVSDLQSMGGQKLDMIFFPKEYNQFPDFFSSESLTYKGILMKGETSIWEGWLIPEQYQANHGGSRKIKVSFRCGLAILKNLKLEDLNLDTSTRITLWEIIHKSLTLTGHNLPVSVFGSISHEGSTGANFFKSTFFRPEVYEGDKLYNILEDILKGFRITQDWITVAGGNPFLCWTIYDYSTLMDLASFTPELYSYDGTLSGLAVDLVQNSSQFGAKVPQNLEAFPSITYDPRVSLVDFKCEMQSRNIIKNKSFSDLDVEGVPAEWVKSSAFYPGVSDFSVINEGDGEGDPVLEFTCEKSDTAGFPCGIHQDLIIPVEKSLNRQMVLSFDYALFYPIPLVADGNQYTFKILVSASLDGGSTYKHGSFVATPGGDGLSVRLNSSPVDCKIPFNEDYSPAPEVGALSGFDLPKYQTIKLDLTRLHDLATGGDDFIMITIRFYAPESLQNNSPTTKNRIKNISLEYVDEVSGDPLEVKGSTSYGTGNKSRSMDSKIGTVLSGEKPAYAFPGALTWEDSGYHKMIRSWNMRGLAFDTYQEMISQLHMNLFAENPMILDATIRNSSKWRKRLIHTHDLKSFLFSGASWDVQKAKVSGQMMGLKTFHTPDPDQLLINTADQLEINEDTNETNQIN